MRFRYSLQKILDLKHNEKKQAEWLLSDALDRLRKEEHSLAELENIRKTLQDMMQQAASRSVPVHELQNIQEYLHHIDRKIREKHEDVERAQGNVQLRRQGLAEKMKEEKVWNRAREHAYERFLLQLRRKEQQELDEMAATRASG